MPKGNNNSNDGWQQQNSGKHFNRISKYLGKNEMNFSENFDEFFKQEKGKLSKEEWEKLVKNFSFKSPSMKPPLVIMFEEDYENLIEMRGLFKNTSRPEYVDTINKILSTVHPSEKHP